MKKALELIDLKRIFSIFAALISVALFLIPQTVLALASGSDPSLLATELVSEFAYDFPLTSRDQLFANKNVLVLVPHQDDEACILGGVFEEYVAYGSNVHVAFTTNGDYDSTDMAHIRAKESIDALSVCGISPENIIFLGYGDQWRNEHIYHARGNKKLTSYVGQTKTYGSDDLHTIYKEGKDYTRNNLKDDIRSVIESIEPDTIFCIDFDGHKDHRCLSLIFEEIMGELLRDNPEYEPTVFKGFGYSTGWHAKQDFYAYNIISSAKPTEKDYTTECNYYNWADRVRFPLAKEALGRLKTVTSTYRMLTCYSSQLASGQAGGILNGDRVFWYRDTASLLYNAKIEVSSGKSTVLNDFRIIDSEDITKVTPVFSGHVWSPREADLLKTATFTFDSPKTISEIRIYDNPDTKSNVLNAIVTLNNGRSFETGPLNRNGAVNRFRFEPISDVEGFTVRLLETEGKNAGLCEVEAYDIPHDTGIKILKLVNETDDFVYDYWISETGEELFSLYVYPGKIPESLEEKYTLEFDSTGGCIAEFTGDRVRVFCPAGKSFDLTIRDNADNTVYDSVRISNPSHARRLLCRMLQHYEHLAGF